MPLQVPRSAPGYAHRQRALFPVHRHLCVWCPGIFMSTGTEFYLRLTQTGCDFSGVSRWERSVSLLECGKIIVPINFSNHHWALAIINLRDRVFQYPHPDRLVSTAHTAPNCAACSTPVQRPHRVDAPLGALRMPASLSS